MKTDNVCLIITGTITPVNGVYVLSLKDPEERYRQYIRSIRYFLKKSKLKNIVFCDNSNTEANEEIKAFAKRCGKRFEWLSFEADHERVVEQGKGYGEGQIMEYVLQHSEICRSCDYLIKITGRLIVENINALLVFAKNGKSYFDNRQNKYVDTRFYMISKENYVKTLLKAYQEVDDRNEKFLENIFLEKLKGGDYSLFPIEIDIEGQGGSDGVIYHKNKLKIFVKSLLRLGKIIK